MKESPPCFAYKGATCILNCPLYELSEKTAAQAKLKAAEDKGIQAEDLIFNVEKAGEIIQTLRALGQSVPEEFIVYCLRKAN